MTIVLEGRKETIEQAKKQLEDVTPVWAVMDHTHSKCIERELLLIKVNAIPEESEETNSLISAAQHRHAITELARLFNAKISDVALDSVTIEFTAKPSRIDAFISLIKPFGILEVSRSGAMAMPRSKAMEELDMKEEIEHEPNAAIDATLLPPG
jgi:acetolactate synthase-1/3 small subunit